MGRRGQCWGGGDSVGEEGTVMGKRGQWCEGGDSRIGRRETVMGRRGQ